METEEKDGQNPNIQKTMHAMDIPADHVTDAMNDKAQLNELEILTTESMYMNIEIQHTLCDEFF